jgi:hypothetical protein
VPDTIRDKVSGSFRSLPEKSLAVSIAGIVPALLSVGKRYKFLGGKELDIALKDHMVAVEVNGVYWHDASRAKSKYAHRDKAKACSENGITLLQFTCQDIDRKLDLVTSMVAAKCGVFSTKLHARKCSVVPLTAAVARSFLDQHHISGFAAGSSYFGLRQGNRLACVAVFGKPRFDKKADWELVRFATHQTVHVSGGLSRLVSSFRKSHPGVLVSYADLRYSNAKGYVASGWKFDRVSTPGYVWVRGGEELSRYQTQKHKLESVLEDFDPSLSESENMRNNKFFQIHDCGHAIFYLR